MGFTFPCCVYVFPHVWCTFGIFGASAISALYLEPARAGSRWLSGSQNCDLDADSLLFIFSTPFGIIGYTDGIIESNRLWATSTSSVHHRAPSFRSWCLADVIWTPTASAPDFKFEAKRSVFAPADPPNATFAVQTFADSNYLYYYNTSAS